MNTYLEKIDASTDWRELQALLDEMDAEIAEAQASPFMEEESYRQQVHDLELLASYGRQKLDKLLS